VHVVVRTGYLDPWWSAHRRRR